MDTNNLIFIQGKSVILRPLLEQDYNLEYLNWLNNPTINEYSQKRPFPTGPEEMKNYNDYYRHHSKEGIVLAVIEKTKCVHIGNVALVNIQPIHRCAEPTIMLGNRDYWNKGYGSECMYLLTKHGFTELNLNKIFAGSFNPAFIKCVERIGWTKEGEFKERIWSNNSYHSQTWMSILKAEFKLLGKYEE